MHEMSLAESMIELVEQTAHRENARRVKTVVLEIGRLAAVEAEALRFCFAAVSKDGIAQGATLEIIDIPGSGWCTACAATVPLTERFGVCPQCGGYQVQATGGTEMRVKEIEIE